MLNFKYSAFSALLPYIKLKNLLTNQVSATNRVESNKSGTEATNRVGRQQMGGCTVFSGARLLNNFGNRQLLKIPFWLQSNSPWLFCAKLPE